jgi:hypothetical protein
VRLKERRVSTHIYIYVYVCIYIYRGHFQACNNSETDNEADNVYVVVLFKITLNKEHIIIITIITLVLQPGCSPDCPNDASPLHYVLCK